MYRVDKRDFAVSEIIMPSSELYQDKASFSPIDMEIERALDETLPHDKNGRASSLFIFSEFSDAIRYSVRMTNSKLYKIRGLEVGTNERRNRFGLESEFFPDRLL
ncbi:hypothetical protein [Ekhidna sp.]|uniref:hypothetical protein n=1 Tax=Ekhidna sp. TaxID=2608089 RepID=UPI003CCC022E